MNYIIFCISKALCAKSRFTTVVNKTNRNYIRIYKFVTELLDGGLQENNSFMNPVQPLTIVLAIFTPTIRKMTKVTY